MTTPKTNHLMYKWLIKSNNRINRYPIFAFKHAQTVRKIY